jgi:heptosyltransferase-2
MRIVVFCPNLIGDTVMATPTLRALRRAYPSAVIHAVIKPTVAPTLDGTSWLDDRILFAPRSHNRDQRMWSVVKRLRNERYDWAVLLPNSFRSALMARLVGIPRRIGYARGGRGWLLTDRLIAPTDAKGNFLPTPAVDYYIALARHLGCTVDSTRLELGATPAEENAANLAWSRLGLSPAKMVIALNTGGAFGPAKNWPIDSFVALAKRLVADRDCSIVVLCGPSERDNAREIARRAADSRVVSMADEPLSIGLTKAAVRRCSLLVTTDSGPRHFATAFGVPVVTLFGPTHIAWTRTHHPRAIHLQHRLPCGPCQKPVCPLGHHRCMTELSPDMVFRACERLLGARVAPSTVRNRMSPSSVVGEGRGGGMRAP